MRVLVADDDASNRYIMSRFLARLGVETCLAADGRSALAVLDAEPGPDLAFLDLAMPQLDGLAIARAIRQDEAARGKPRRRLVALSGADDGAEAMEAGFDDFLQKPASYGAIEAAIARWGRGVHGT